MGTVGAPVSMGQREMTSCATSSGPQGGQVLVIPHLDLLAGGADGSAPRPPTSGS